MRTHRIELTRGWTLRLAGPGDPAGDPAALPRETPPPVPATVAQALPVPATVPGTVHTDLLAAGLVPDPYLDRNEEVLGWIGHQAWVYETTFDAPAGPDGQRVVLEFDGLDTLATVAVNGTVVARTENQHRRYAFDVTDLVATGPNELALRFDSAWAFGENEQDRHGRLPGPWKGYPFNYVRKMACNFGWDWGPTLVTAGIWRPVRLVTFDHARIAGATARASLDRTAVLAPDGERAGRIDVEIVLDPADATEDLWVSVSVRSPGASGSEVLASVDARVGADASGGRAPRAVSIPVPVDDVDPWWPRDLGAQPLYDVTVAVRSAPGGEPPREEPAIDEWTTRVGFRSVELDTAPDETGAAFRIVVNGVAVPVRGANWIPDDCFPSRLTVERLRERVAQATDAHLNLLRVWGGGLYESDEFYRICDEEGVLVWQDFLFACAAYPEHERLWTEVEAEARDNVARLAPHPSLVLWNANNENTWAYEDWGWREDIGDRAWGLGYYEDLLPRVVAQTDPTRPFWPGSPYSGGGVHPNADTHGCKHIWDTWNEVDYAVYRSYRPRFVSEFGWQAPPTWSTLTRSIHDDPLTPTSPGVMLHQKADDGNGKLERGMAPHFGAVTAQDASMTDWHYLTQVNQARAVSVAVGHFRSLRPLCWGSIVWQINDCWPVTSWAVVDGDGHRKPAWYALRSASAPRAAFIEPTGALTGGPADAGLDGADDLALTLVNDLPEPWSTTVGVRRVDLTGATLAETAFPVHVDALGTARLDLPATVVCVGDRSGELLVATVAGAERAWWFFAEDVETDLPTPSLEVGWRRDGASDDTVVTVTTDGLVKDLCLFADRVAPDAEADTQLVTLLPGETHEFHVTGVPLGREHELIRAPVLRHLAEGLSSVADGASRAGEGA